MVRRIDVSPRAWYRTGAPTAGYNPYIGPVDPTSSPGVEGTAMVWQRLESEEDVPRFIDAAVDLHCVLFDRLSTDDRPFFCDYWLRLLNDAHAWLLVDEDPAGRPLALVTVPSRPDLHEYRWRTRTL